MTILSRFHLDRLLHRGSEHADVRPQKADWSELVGQAASAIRRGEIDLAEWLINEHGDEARHSAECLNLLGIVALSGGEWTKALRLWRQAFRANGTYEPVRRNLRRYFELCSFGKTIEALALGDEPEFQIGFRKERS